MQISECRQHIPKIAPPSPTLTFLMPSGFRCKVTSFSGLTTGILNTIPHILRRRKERKGNPKVIVRKVRSLKSRNFAGVVRPAIFCIAKQDSQRGAPHHVHSKLIVQEHWKKRLSLQWVSKMQETSWQLQTRSGLQRVLHELDCMNRGTEKGFSFAVISTSRRSEIVRSAILRWNCWLAELHLQISHRDPWHMRVSPHLLHTPRPTQFHLSLSDSMRTVWII